MIVVGCWLFVLCCLFVGRAFVVCCCLLAVGYYCWLLVVCCSLFVVCCSLFVGCACMMFVVWDECLWFAVRWLLFAD